jgi:hypothetical protein
LVWQGGLVWSLVVVGLVGVVAPRSSSGAWIGGLDARKMR